MGVLWWENALPTISNVWKKQTGHVAAASRSRSTSHNALPDHQRETKMANALGENEPFVIFWGRQEPRSFSRHAFEVESTPGETCRNWTHTLIFLLPEWFVVVEVTEWGIVVVMFSSRGGCGSDGQWAAQGYGLACGLLLLTGMVYCHVLINDPLACSVSSKFPVV